MPDSAGPRSDGTGRRRRTPLVLLHGLAAALVVAGVLAQAIRPLAPEIGPALPAGTWFEAEHLRLVEAYRGPRLVGSAVSFTLGLAVPLLVAFTPWGRRAVAAVVDGVGPRRPGLAAAAVVVAVLVAVDLVRFPLAFWFGFVHEGAFGFRTQGLGGWLRDWLVVRAPLWLGAAALVPVAYALVRRLPRAWPPVAGLAGAGLVAVVVAGGPLVLEPLMFRTERLPAGAVRAEVERVLERAGERVDEIVVADASRRTTKRNAYVSGLGPTRRVVLYDNLVEQQPSAEVGLVLAHEVGHDQHGDLPRGVVAGGAGVVLVVYVLAGTLRVATRRGRLDAPWDPRGAALALAVVVALGAAAQPAERWLSRRAEAAADAAALEIVGDPATYLSSTEGLARANLSDPEPPRWAYLLWATHPSTAERLTMGERWPLDAES